MGLANFSFRMKRHVECPHEGLLYVVLCDNDFMFYIKKKVTTWSTLKCIITLTAWCGKADNEYYLFYILHYQIKRFV